VGHANKEGLPFINPSEDACIPKKKKKRSPEPASAFNAEAALESENS
jgi:hypothetical protein